jgi:putative intracellular protease/amidase
VAVAGINDAAETTDYLLPAGVLRRADVAEVVMLATARRPVRLFPALTVLPDASLGAFDAAHPAGADYVIVPAMSRDDDPQLLAWLRRQAAGGATVIGVCAGAKVVAAAGLLDGRRATTHWYHRAGMLRRHPMIHYVPDRRMVADAGVVTTTGISASVPMMLTLIEAIAGRAKAQAVAGELGVAQWDARHASGAFGLTRQFATTVLRQRLSFWRHEALGIALAPGMDAVSLALAADAWSRTYRSRALTFASSGRPVLTRGGIRVLPERVAAHWPANRRVPTFPDQPPAAALDAALEAIAARYGAPAAAVVAMQLEYPSPANADGASGARQQPTRPDIRPRQGDPP